MKRVLMIIAPENFRDEEFIEPYNIFKDNDVDVVVASTEPGMKKGMLGAEVEAQVSYKDVTAEDYDAVVYVGGSGAASYFEDETALSLARNAAADHKIVAAICIAPSILANAGLLEGKNATVYPSEKGNLEAKGAHYTADPVTIDGNIVTANGPDAAKEFAEKIIGLLH